MQVEPMDAVLDPTVESVALMWASQTAGKTELINNLVGYFVDQDPSPILILQPTIDMGKAWSNDRLTPMIRDTPQLRGTIKEAKSRDGNNTILHKTFPGGHLTIVGANAPAGLAMRPIRVVVCDEIDRYPASAGDEGDPISLAEKRTDTFWDAVQFKVSTPTIKGLSRVETEFELTDKRYWFVPCPHCDHWQTLKWSQVQWEKGKPETACMVCESCKAHLTDEDRVAMVKRGEWRPTAQFKGKRGYHLNGLYSLFRHKKGYQNRLHQAVVQFLEANQGGEETLKTWVNTFLAETFEKESEKIDAAPLLGRCETYKARVPMGGLVLVAGVDVQNDYLEAEITAFGQDEESWGVEHARFLGDTEQDDVWNQLDNFLLQEFEHESGQMLRVAATAIDTGNRPKSVYKFVRSCAGRRVFAVKGSSMGGAPLVSRPRRSSVRDVKLFTVGTDTAKEIIYARLKVQNKGPRYMHFPLGHGYDAEFFDQLTAEKVTIEIRRGFRRRVWVKTRARNECLDVRVYQLAALEILNPDYAAIQKRIETPKSQEPNKPEVTEKPTVPPSRPRTTGKRPMRSGGSKWVTGWRR